MKPDSNKPRPATAKHAPSRSVLLAWIYERGRTVPVVVNYPPRMEGLPLSLHGITDAELLAEYRRLFAETHEAYLVERIRAERLERILTVHARERERDAEAQKRDEDKTDRLKTVAAEHKVENDKLHDPEEVEARKQRLRDAGVTID